MRPREEEFFNLAKKVWAERLYQSTMYGTERVQHDKLGSYAAYYNHKLAVLMEEVGEVAKCINDAELGDNIESELIQVMAVCAAIYEFTTLDLGLVAFNRESNDADDRRLSD